MKTKPAVRPALDQSSDVRTPSSAIRLLSSVLCHPVPNNARLYVEEAGNRRPLANWSEIGV